MPEISRALRSDIGTAGIGGLAVGIVTALRVRIRRIRALRIRVVARLAIRIITTLRIGIGRGEIETLHPPLPRIALVQSRSFVALGGSVPQPVPDDGIVGAEGEGRELGTGKGEGG